MAGNADTRWQAINGYRILGFIAFIALATAFHIGWWLVAPSEEKFLPNGLAAANVVAVLVGFVGDRLLRSAWSVAIVPVTLVMVGTSVFLVIEAYRQGLDYAVERALEPVVTVVIVAYGFFWLFWLGMTFYGLAAAIGAAASLLIRDAQARHWLCDAISPR